MASLELRQITVRRHGQVVLDGVDLAVDDGELLAVVGESGAGKSTLLRAVAGLDPVDAGQVLLDGADVTQVEPAGRGVAMVHQQAAMLPRRTVRGNVAFPLEIRHVPDDEVRARVDAESRALHIESLLARSPDELSVGEQQLVQIARAMVRVPGLLLLDEPLTHLDPGVRARLRRELRELQQGYAVTTLLTTNEPVEAMVMPDRVAVLVSGRVVQLGSPIDVYREPFDLATAALTGEISPVRVRVEADSTGWWLDHPAFRVRAWRPSLAALAGGSVVMGVRLDGAVPDPAGDVDAVVTAVDLGASTPRLRCLVGDDVIEVVAGHTAPRRGDRIRLRLEHYLLFDPVTGRRLM